MQLEKSIFIYASDNEAEGAHLLDLWFTPLPTWLTLQIFFNKKKVKTMLLNWTCACEGNALNIHWLEKDAANEREKDKQSH